MQCAEIMKTAVECTSPRDTVRHAASCMRDKNIGFLPVCDATGEVIGTLTDRDIAIRVVAEGKPLTTLVEQAMTREIVSCRPEAELKEAERQMAIHRKSRILCIGKDGRPAGVISLSDIAQQDSGGVRSSRILQQVSEREARA
jgi:CBS domain-containing protein